MACNQRSRKKKTALKKEQKEANLKSTKAESSAASTSSSSRKIKVKKPEKKSKASRRVKKDQKKSTTSSRGVKRDSDGNDLSMAEAGDGDEDSKPSSAEAPVDSPPEDAGGGGEVMNGDPDYDPKGCSICGTSSSVRRYKDPDTGQSTTFCNVHNPHRTFNKTKAVKYFSKYKDIGGNLNDCDLLRAEIDGLLKVRRRRNRHTRSGEPKVRLYFVRELYELSRAKRAKKEEDDQAKKARKEEEAQLKLAQRIERKAKAEQLRADKKAQQEKEKAEKKAARACKGKTTSRRAEDEGAHPDPGGSAEAGTSSMVTVSSIEIIEISDDEADETMAPLAPQAPPSIISTADPQPSIEDPSVKSEPGLELPMIPEDAHTLASDTNAFHVKEEIERPLFLAVDP
ncbi:hypothetical protein A4X09_0g95 [Tilletia walkeri]|uniref:Uncharacterized protein n=1 Tax=Tilletia walkeri TaxID=117179 RepID=A0A8X7T8B4_9BASI|nr:hypothetical protein A4X09_0g95 [Tilletia walkeri]